MAVWLAACRPASPLRLLPGGRLRPASPTRWHADLAAYRAARRLSRERMLRSPPPLLSPLPSSLPVLLSQEDSTLSVGHGENMEELVTGQNAIRSVTARRCGGSAHFVPDGDFDAMPSKDNSIMLVVTGVATREGLPPRQVRA